MASITGSRCHVFLLTRPLRCASQRTRCRPISTCTIPSQSFRTRLKRNEFLKSHQRYFSKSCSNKVNSQEAPNAKAYLESGAISGARNLVDVSKVLVIGSGGLSIGQAGEFDYSGVTKMTYTSFLILVEYLTLNQHSRFTGTESSQRGRGTISSYKSQHCDHPNRPRPC